MGKADEAYRSTQLAEGREPEELAREVVDQLVRQTARPAVAFDLQRGAVDLLGSFLGGRSYYTLDGERVVSRAGDPLYPLVQLRCSEVPLEPYPGEGLLQVFYRPGELYGANLDDPCDQDGWRVRFIPDVPAALPVGEGVAAPVGEVVTLPEVGPGLDTPFEPGFRGAGLQPRSMEQGITLSCEDFDAAYARATADVSAAELAAADVALEGGVKGFVEDLLGEEESVPGVQAGGYPTFTQWDVRDLDVDPFQLVQIDSINDVTSWGDSGIAHVFVPRADLARLNFSRAAYTWDCY